MHPCSVSRKVKKYDRDGFVDRKRFGRTHVTFGDPTEYAKELGINGIVSGPDCRKSAGRTHVTFGESARCATETLKRTGNERRSIWPHTHT